jgi:DNA (cytosine-5)-methyltransferase 1
MKVLSLFSGVGGFDLGLEAAGMETVALCEWDKKAASVLRHHWPDIPIYGDVSELTGAQLLADGIYPDLVAFGSPCQDLSVAGKRAGLEGGRSGLFHEATRIIRELRALTNGALPRWSIWENVAGAFSSNNGKDFGAVLAEMDDLGACFSEWGLLDAQNYGVAQRRRRVFLVSCFDSRAAQSSPDPLLPVGKGGPRDIAPLRAAWKNTPGGVAAGLRSGGDGGVPSSRGEHLVSLVDGRRTDDVRVYEEPVQTLAARMGTGGNNVPMIMAPSVNFDEMNFAGGEELHHTLRAGTRQSTGVVQPMAFSHTQGLDIQPSIDHWPTLRAEGQGHAVIQPFVKAARAQSAEGYETWKDGDVTPTLNSFDNAGESRATVTIVHGTDKAVETLAARDYKGISADSAETHLVAYGIAGNIIGRQDHNGGNGSGFTELNGPMFTLTARDRLAVATPYAVRRLTPLECERLQGWPDNWTLYDADGKEQTDGHRYKQCGNGVASPVAEWVGRQIFAADALR